MTRKNLHIPFSRIWFLLPVLLFANCILANTSQATINTKSCKENQKSTINFLSNQSIPIGCELPKDSPSENHLSNSDIEEIVDPFAVKNFAPLDVSVCASTEVIIKYKEAGNRQYQPNIVPPPPKF